MSAATEGARYALRFQDVHKTFGEHRVLAGLTMAVPRAGITMVIGRSGTGKSVSFKHAMGLLRPDSGRIWVGDQEVTAMGRKELRLLRLEQRKPIFKRLKVGETHSRRTQALECALKQLDLLVFPVHGRLRLGEPVVVDLAHEVGAVLVLQQN